MAFAALFDPLYCPEEHLDLYQEEAGPAVLDDELPALFESLRAKELVAAHGYAGREAAVEWSSRAAARLGFSALTAALAAAYLDRCFLGGAAALRLAADQPWMARLAAVACVALAAKVEETRVPVLVDLQLCAADDGDGACVFDAATVRRMELLVLSALQWRMHPVTPFSYLDPLLAHAAARRQHCETVLLALITDWRWPQHRPSAWAAAALLATASGGDNDTELLALIDAAEDEVAECAKIISEATGLKRKRMYSPPLSPSGVIGALSGFSCESSSSSFDSPELAGRPPKRAAVQLPHDEESRDAWPPSTCAA